MGKKATLDEINIIRWLMILWIFVTHFFEHYEKGAYFANPSQYWPSLSERFAQLQPLPVEDVGSVISNLFRYLGLFGDQGVQVFFVISGFVLTLSILSKNQSKIVYRDFLSRRLAKIYPSWVVAHITLMIVWLVIGKGINPFSIRSWFSLVGIRFLPQTMYYAVPAWWFIGCLIQLYLIFPIIYNSSIGRKSNSVLWWILFGSILIRFLGLYLSRMYAPGFIGYWSRGMLFFGRLPEFTAGIIIAQKYFENPKHFIKTIHTTKTKLLFLGMWVAGNLSSFYYSGMSIAFLLTGVGLFMFLWGMFSQYHNKISNVCSRYAAETYEFYIVHHVVIIAFVPTTFVSSYSAPLYFIFVLVASILLALVLNKLVGICHIRLFFSKLIDFVLLRYKTVFATLTILYFLALSGELLVQRYDPQEVLGWGERPALQPHEEFGYTLIPNKTTRLRWQSYDYVVTANTLGFPGPLYPAEKSSNTYRIMVTGDAFSSAEGVDTDESWPRLLEKYLNEKSDGITYEVLNFSITGWGPQHYSRVINNYIKKYKPDLIILGVFINDLTDVLYSDEKFNSRIGFTNSKLFGMKATVTLKHLRSYVSYKANDFARLFFSNILPKDYYLGLPDLLEMKNKQKLIEGSVLFQQHLTEIKNVSKKYGSDLFAIIIPSSLQVAPFDELDYVANKNKLDVEKYDIRQPQQIIDSVLQKPNINRYDLRELFSDNITKGIYQPKNMHWTEKGHRLVAQFVAETVYKRLR